MTLRPELERLPARLLRLKVDERGYPVPWFVAWVDGKPEFRAMDVTKWMRAVRDRLCWVCGEQLGIHLSFVVGPMCGVNRTTTEPPSHLGCAQWSARNCPFLSRPQMVRREDDVSRACEGNVAGEMIKRNPGVTLIWNCRRFSVWNDGRGRPLITMGDPDSVEWWMRGRRASREEVAESVASGLPALMEIAAGESTKAIEELQRRTAWLETLYPSQEAGA